MVLGSVHFSESLLLTSVFLHLFLNHLFFDNRSSRKDEDSQSMKEYTDTPSNKWPLEP